jgi:hypothetical protein
MKDHMITLEWDGTAPSTQSLALITLDPLKEQTSLRLDITEAAVLASVQECDPELFTYAYCIMSESSPLDQLRERRRTRCSRC